MICTTIIKNRRGRATVIILFYWLSTAQLYWLIQTGQLSVALRIAPPACNTAEQEQLIVKLHIAVYQPDIRQFENISINADIALAVVMRFGSLSLHNDLCSMVDL